MPIDFGSHFDAIKTNWLYAPEGAGERRDAEAKPAPFVTIARDAGCGARGLAGQLAERLNASAPEGEKWEPYDRELVEKIAADHDLSEAMVESMEDRDHNWLRSMLDGMFNPGQPSEEAVFNRMAGTIRAVARRGRGIIVGRGGMLVTRDMAAGVHVYLTAPREVRIERMSQRWQISQDAAAKRIRENENNRRSFYRRFFPKTDVTPEVFTVTLNVAQVPDETAVEVLMPLIERAP